MVEDARAEQAEGVGCEYVGKIGELVRQSSIARSIAKQLSWEVKQDQAELNVEVAMGGVGSTDTWMVKMKIHEEDSPSMRLGMDGMEAMYGEGWKLEEESWQREGRKPRAFESEVTVQGEMIFGVVKKEASDSDESGAPSWASDGESEGEGRYSKDEDEQAAGGKEQRKVARKRRVPGRVARASMVHEELLQECSRSEEEDEFWRDRGERHQGKAVDGEEPGGMVDGDE